MEISEPVGRKKAGRREVVATLSVAAGLCPLIGPFGAWGAQPTASESLPSCEFTGKGLGWKAVATRYQKARGLQVSKTETTRIQTIWDLDDTRPSSVFVGAFNPTGADTAGYPTQDDGTSSAMTIRFPGGASYRSAFATPETVEDKKGVVVGRIYGAGYEFNASDASALTDALIAAGKRDGGRIEISIDAYRNGSLLHGIDARTMDVTNYDDVLAWGQKRLEDLETEFAEKKCKPASKVVCSAMNEVYGFGQFRNAIWLRYSDRCMTPAHERGYHLIALPMIRFAYGGESRGRRWLRRGMEHVARERTADLRAVMGRHRRRPLGAFYRSALEPLCFVLGRVLEWRDGWRRGSNGCHVRQGKSAA